MPVTAAMSSVFVSSRPRSAIRSAAAMSFAAISAETGRTLSPSPGTRVWTTSPSPCQYPAVTGSTDRFGPDGTPSVVIVGGGFGGIAAGVKLKKAGIRTFTIVERSLGVGGVWWDNTYPGCEVDVASHVYSYSFVRHDWTRTHARRDELQKYLEGVVDEFDLR